MSFEVNEKITLDGNLPAGSHYSTAIKSAGIVALIVMKAHAMNIRKKSKDAYDIWFCLANYPGNVERIAKDFKQHVEKKSVKTAVALLSENFKSFNDRGPKDVVKEDGTTDSDYSMFLQQDAYQRVQALLGIALNLSSRYPIGTSLHTQCSKLLRSVLSLTMTAPANPVPL